VAFHAGRTHGFPSHFGGNPQLALEQTSGRRIFSREAVTRRSTRRLSRIAKGRETRCSKRARARIAKGGGLIALYLSFEGMES